MSEFHYQQIDYSNQVYWLHPIYEGLPVITNHGPLLTNHLKALKRTLDSVLASTPRAYAVRFDLRLPVETNVMDTELISRFFNAFRYLLEVADNQKIKEGKRVHAHKLRYSWTREWGLEGRPHYHIIIYLNHDRYRTLGNFKHFEGNLSARIKTAWAIALGQNPADAARLVHFPKNPEYRLIQNSSEYYCVVGYLFFRISYFAKLDTKVFGLRQRSFGTSIG